MITFLNVDNEYKIKLMRRADIFHSFQLDLSRKHTKATVKYADIFKNTEPLKSKQFLGCTYFWIH